MAPKSQKIHSDSKSKYQVFIEDSIKLVDMNDIYLATGDLKKTQFDLQNLNEMIAIIEAWGEQDFGPTSVQDVIDKLKDKMGYNEAFLREMEMHKTQADNSAKELDEDRPYALSVDELKLLRNIVGHPKGGGGIKNLSREQFLEQLDKAVEREYNSAKTKIDAIIQKINHPKMSKFDIEEKRDDPDMMWEDYKSLLNRKLDQAHQAIENKSIYNSALSKQRAMDEEIKFLTGERRKDGISFLKEKREKVQAYIAPIIAIGKDADKYEMKTVKNAVELKQDLGKVQKKIKELKREDAVPRVIDSWKRKEEKLLRLTKPAQFYEAHQIVREHIKWLPVIMLRTHEALMEELDELFTRAKKGETLQRGTRFKGFFSSGNSDDIEPQLTKGEMKIIQCNNKQIKALREMAKGTLGEDVSIRVEIESWKKIEAEIERLESKNEELMANIPLQSKNSDVSIIENNIHYLKEGIRGISLEGKSKTTQEKIAKHLESVKEQIEDLRCNIDEILSEENTATPPECRPS